jgi:hypothetical protein
MNLVGWLRFPFTSLSVIFSHPAVEPPTQPASRTAVLPRALAVASFLIYAASIFALPQVRDSRYCCEQSSFAAAVSHIVYGSRVGSMYTGVFDLFMTHFAEPLPQTLKEILAELPAQPPGRLSQTTLDGNGVGYPLVATAAFWLFGFHWWAPITVMLVLMAASLATFLRRFPPTLVTLYFSGLTAMLFTVLVWNPAWRVQIPVGGVRYFSLVGILPLFHILLSLMERRPFRDTAPLAIQATILMVAALARGTAATALVAIAVVGLALARDRARRPALIRKLATIGVAGLTLVGAVALVVSPQWLTTGRFQTIIWTRATQSLGMNPSLPIADLNKMYPCEKYVPGGIPPGIGDQGGGCIWFAYVIEHNIPVDALWNKSFGGEFETAMRRAFFRIAMKYPWETLQTFVYYKPKAIIVAIEDSLPFNLSGDPPVSLVLLLTSLGIALFAATTAIEIGSLTAIVLLATLCNALAYMAAYANAGTTGDLLLYCLIATGLALGAIVSGATKLAVSRIYSRRASQ